MLRFFHNILRKEDGQSMVEYSLITFFLLGVGGTSLLTMVGYIYEAYEAYVASFYYLLSLPIP